MTKTEIVSMEFYSTMMQLISLENFTAFHHSKSFEFNTPHRIKQMKRRYHKLYPELLLKDTDRGSPYNICPV
jgi:hypothetical protein